MSNIRDPGDDIPAIALITSDGTRYFAVRIHLSSRCWVTCTLEHPRSPPFLLLLRKRRVDAEMSDHSGPFLFGVPKAAIRHVPEEKLEKEAYTGTVYGYGGTVDAIR